MSYTPAEENSKKVKLQGGKKNRASAATAAAVAASIVVSGLTVVSVPASAETISANAVIAAPSSFGLISGTAQLAAKWVAPTGIFTGYKLVYATDSGFTQNVQTVEINDPTVTTYTISGLANGTAYYVKVGAFDGSESPIKYTAYKTAKTFSTTLAPAAPKVVAGNSSSTVSWTAPAISTLIPAVTGYTLEYSKKSDFTESQTVSVSGAIKSKLITGLETNTTYYYRVKATNAVGDSVFSASASASTYKVAAAPTTLTAVKTGNYATLAWAAPLSTGGSLITGYKIEYATNPDFTNSSVVSQGSIRTYKMLNLQPSKTYYYRVAAVTAVGQGDWSNTANFVSFGVPTSPATLTVLGGVNKITINWTAPSNNGGTTVTGYRLEYSKNADFSNATVVSPTASTLTSYIITTPGTTYYVRVAAKNIMGQSEWSTTSATSVAAPSGPTSFTATAGVNKITATWAAPTATEGQAVTGYKFEYSTNADFSSSKSLTTSATTLTASAIGLLQGTTYYVRAYAKTSVGYGTPTETSTVTTAAAPSAPINFTANGGPAKLTSSWAAPTNNGGSPVTGYRFEYSTNADFSSSKSLTTSSLITTATPTGLLPDTTYYVRVFAKTLVGESVASELMTATTAAAPSAPQNTTNLVTHQATTSTVRINWEAPASAGDYPVTGYTVKYSTDSNFPATTATKTVTVKTLYASLANLKPNTTYYVRVTANSLAGASNPVDLTVSTVTATAPAQVATPSVSLNSSDIDVSWTAPASNGSAITGYIVEYADNAEFVGANSVNSDVTSATLTGLTAGSTYYVRIKAVNAVGTSVPSTSANVTVPVVSDGKVTAESLINGKSVSWMAMYGASSVWTADTPYLVVDAYGYYYTSSGSGWLNVLTTPEQLLANGWSTSDSKTFTDAYGNIFYLDVHGNSIKLNPSYAANASYAYAVDANGKAYPLELPAAATTPTSPRDVTTVSQDSAITVTFKAPASDGLSPVSTYTVEYSKDATFATGVQTISVDAGFNKTVELTGLDYQQKYYIKVTAVGTTGSSTPVTVEASATDGTVNTGVTASELIVNASEGWSSWFYYSPTWTETFKMLRVYSNGNQSPTVGYTYITRFQSDNVWGLSGDTKADIIASAVNQYGFTQSTNANGETVLTKTEVWDWDSNGGQETGIIFKNEGSIYEYTRYLNDTAVSHDSTTYLQKANGAIYTFGAPSENFVAPVAPTVPVPAAPKNVVVESLFENANLRIRWDNWGTSVQPITGYRVEYSTNADFSNAVVVNTTNTSYMFDSPQLGKTYYVKVYAISSAGTSVAGTGSLVMAADPRPSAPTVSAADLTYDSATINWTTPADNASAVTGYILQYSTDASFSSASTVGTLQGNSYAVTGLTVGTTYYARVLVVNNVGEYVYSNVASFATVSATAPSQIATPTATLNGSDIDVAWTAPAANGSAITGYLLEYADNADFTGATSVNVDGTTKTLTGLTAGSTYYVRVKAVNAVGSSVASASASASIPVPVPLSVTSLDFTTAYVSDSNLDVNISWTAPTSGATPTSYTVTATAPETGTITIEYPADRTATNAVIRNQPWGKNYTITVVANAASGSSTPVSITKLANPAPRAVTGLTVEQYVDGSGFSAIGAVNLSWTPSTFSYLSGYTIEYSTDATFATNVTTLDHSQYVYVFNRYSSNVSVSGLTEGATYYFRVKANSGFGGVTVAGEGSTPVSFTVPSSPTFTIGGVTYTYDASIANTPYVMLGPSSSWSESTPVLMTTTDGTNKYIFVSVPDATYTIDFYANNGKNAQPYTTNPDGSVTSYMNYANMLFRNYSSGLYNGIQNIASTPPASGK